jgi:hypothetical protein
MLPIKFGSASRILLGATWIGIGVNFADSSLRCRSLYEPMLGSRFDVPGFCKSHRWICSFGLLTDSKACKYPRQKIPYRSVLQLPQNYNLVHNSHIQALHCFLSELPPLASLRSNNRVIFERCNPKRRAASAAVLDPSRTAFDHFLLLVRAQFGGPAKPSSAIASGR